MNPIDKLIIVLASLMAFFTPIILMMWLIVSLTTFDLYTAILRAYKIKEVQSIKGFGKRFVAKFKIVKSRKLRRTVIKTFLYILFLMSVYAIPMVIFGHDLYVVNAAALLISSLELKSIAENCDFIVNKNIFTTIFRRFRKGTEDVINKAIEE